MNDPYLDLTHFEGTTRLFPLPNVVLFPHAVLPLHIFEPRYRQMTADALASDQFLTMVLLQDGWEADYDGRPAVYEVACLGKVLGSQQLPDGRYDLLLFGLSRVRIAAELPPDQLYRVAEVDLLPDTNRPSDTVAWKPRTDLAQAAERWFHDLGWDATQANKLAESSLSLGAMADLLAFKLPLPIDFKQHLLAEVDVQQRVQQLAAHLRAHAPPQAMKAARSFPPPFSVN